MTLSCRRTGTGHEYRHAVQKALEPEPEQRVEGEVARQFGKAEAITLRDYDVAARGSR